MKNNIICSASLFLISFALASNPAPAAPCPAEQDSSIDPDKAARYFREAEEISEADGGKLWGLELYGPMLFVDRNTRFLVANRQNGSGTLRRRGDIFLGKLDEKISIANTSFRWHGEDWMMILWESLSDDPYKRNRLIMHELWHCNQSELGFPGVPSHNRHLNKMKGRFLLRMEWRALAHALKSSGEKRRQAAGDAVLFRRLRRHYFPGTDSTENSFEMHEGLAEYTGQRLCGLPLDEIGKQLAGKLLSAPRKLSYVNSFAYNSGAAYGILLDCIGADWRSGLAPGDDFGEILENHYGIIVPAEIEPAARKRFPAYHGEELLEEERELEKKRTARINRYRKMYVNGPVLVLPNAEMKLSYDPRRIYDLGEHGTVYAYAIAIADWGKLTAEEGLLRSPDWSSITVPAKLITGPEKKIIRGDGWTLELSSGWKINPSADGKTYKVSKE